MSARSFGFIKPSQKFRDNDMANRIRRHQSFFNADTSSITGESLEKMNLFLEKHHDGPQQQPLNLLFSNDRVGFQPQRKLKELRIC